MQGCEWATDYAIALAGLAQLQELDVSYTPFGDCALASLAVVSRWVAWPHFVLSHGRLTLLLHLLAALQAHARALPS